MCVKPAATMVAQNLVHMTQSIRADDRPSCAVPREHVDVVSVVIIEVAAIAGTFTDGAKRDLAQASDFSKRPGNLFGTREQNLFVARCDQNILGRQLRDFSLDEC